MSRNIKGTVLAFLGICALYWIPALFFPGTTMIEVSAALVIGFGLAAAGAWSWSTVRAASQGVAEARHLFIMALFIGQFALVARGAWTNVWRGWDRPEWMIDSPAFGFIMFLSAVSSAGLVLTPGITAGEMPPRNWIVFAIALTLASIILGFMLGQQMAGR